MGLGCQSNAKPPTRMVRASVFVWTFTLDLSCLGDSTSGYTALSIPHEISRVHKPHHHSNAGGDMGKGKGGGGWVGGFLCARFTKMLAHSSFCEGQTNITLYIQNCAVMHVLQAQFIKYLYQHEKCFSQTLWREIEHILCQVHFCLQC